MSAGTSAGSVSSSSANGNTCSRTLDVATPHYQHDGRTPLTQYRGMSPEDAEAAGGVEGGVTEGSSGAEWTSLQWHSSRSENFTEEEMWYRIGCVTRGGVLIEGTDPMRGSWLGEMLGMQSSQGCVCVLSTMMVMYVADLSKKRCRKIPISVGEGGLENRARYAKSNVGHALLRYGESSSKGETPVVVYDVHNGAVVKVWPRDGRVVSMSVQRPAGPVGLAGLAGDEAKRAKGAKGSGGKIQRKDDIAEVECAGTLSGMSIALYFTPGGSEIVMVALEKGESLRIQVPLPETWNGIQSIVPMSSSRLLLRCGSSNEEEEIVMEFQVESWLSKHSVNKSFLIDAGAWLDVLSKCPMELRRVLLSASSSSILPLDLLTPRSLPAFLASDDSRSSRLHVTSGTLEIYYYYYYFFLFLYSSSLFIFFCTTIFNQVLPRCMDRSLWRRWETATTRRRRVEGAGCKSWDIYGSAR